MGNAHSFRGHREALSRGSYLTSPATCMNVLHCCFQNLLAHGNLQGNTLRQLISETEAHGNDPALIPAANARSDL